MLTYTFFLLQNHLKKNLNITTDHLTTHRLTTSLQTEILLLDLARLLPMKLSGPQKGGPQILAAGGSLILNGSGTVRLSVKDSLSIGMNGGGGVKNCGPFIMKIYPLIISPVLLCWIQ